MRIIGRRSWRLEQTGLLQPFLPFPFSGYSCPGCGNFCKHGDSVEMPERPQLWYALSWLQEPRVARKAASGRARAPSPLCAPQDFYFFGSPPRGGARDAEGSRRRPPHRRFPPLPVLHHPRRGGPCGPQALILSDTPHHHPKHENLKVPAWQVP